MKIIKSNLDIITKFQITNNQIRLAMLLILIHNYYFKHSKHIVNTLFCICMLLCKLIYFYILKIYLQLLDDIYCVIYNTISLYNIFYFLRNWRKRSHGGI